MTVLYVLLMLAGGAGIGACVAMLVLLALAWQDGRADG